MCLFLGILGLAIRVATVGFAAAGSAGANPEDRADSLDTSGMYSVMRHPYLFGTLLMWFGIAAFPRKWWLPALTIAAFWVYYEGLMAAEEQALRRKFGRGYVDWAVVTPRFLPRPSLWKRPQVAFSLGRVLRREHTALLALVTCLTFLEVIADLNITSHIGLDPVWGCLFGSTAVVYAMLSVLKQRRHASSSAASP
jgi:steroid 5-alpha reductase family enzyme